MRRSDTSLNVEAGNLIKEDGLGSESASRLIWISILAVRTKWKWSDHDARDGHVQQRIVRGTVAKRILMRGLGKSVYKR